MIPKPDGNSGARPVPTDSQVSSGEFELIDFKSDRDFENFGNSSQIACGSEEITPLLQHFSNQQISDSKWCEKVKKNVSIVAL